MWSTSIEPRNSKVTHTLYWLWCKLYCLDEDLFDNPQACPIHCTWPALSTIRGLHGFSQVESMHRFPSCASTSSIYSSKYPRDSRRTSRNATRVFGDRKGWRTPYITCIHPVRFPPIWVWHRATYWFRFICHVAMRSIELIEHYVL